MSKIKKLKLSEIQILNDEDLKLTSMSNSYSNSGYNDYEYGGYFCPDECTSDRGCAEKLGINSDDAKCQRVACFGGLLGSYLKCFEMSAAEKACSDKKLGDKCSVGNKAGVCSNTGGRANYCFLRGYGDGFYGGN